MQKVIAFIIKWNNNICHAFDDYVSLPKFWNQIMGFFRKKKQSTILIPNHSDGSKQKQKKEKKK